MKNKFESSDIRLNVHATTREEAIAKSADILIQKGIITKGYVEEIYEVLENLGPYFVLAPGIAFAHSKPSANVLQSGISIMTLDEPVYFGHEKNDPVFLVVVIASTDSESHLGQLQKIVGFLSDEKNVVFLRNATKEDEMLKIVNMLNKGEN